MGEDLVKAAAAVYGTGFGTERLARKRGKPYVVISEYCLKTQLVGLLRAPLPREFDIIASSRT
jgi:hypothetical protein